MAAPADFGTMEAERLSPKITKSKTIEPETEIKGDTNKGAPAVQESKKPKFIRLK